MGTELGGLEAALGYAFQNKELLVRALTHKSHRFERPVCSPDVLADNEQLEFLGDAILGFVVSEILVRRNPALPEGALSKRKAHLVSSQHLYEVAQSIGLGQYLLLGKGEEQSGGRGKRALLANAVEALIAALHLDGGLEVSRRFVQTHVVSEQDLLDCANGEPVSDYKSALQERTQMLQLPPPRYSIVREQGPEHSKVFTVEVRVGREVSTRGEGYSKKSAGQRAAQQALDLLRGPGEGDSGTAPGDQPGL